MTPDIFYLYSFAFSMTLIALASWLAATIEARMKKDDVSSGTSLIPHPAAKNVSLRPVETAYMLRGGDTNHALLVMGVDLLQRAAKLQFGAAIPEPAEYEKKMWALAKDTAKEWALKKVDPYLPPDLKKNPVGFVKKIYDIYLFCTKSLKLVVKDIIADPRQLKRYFSVAGVMRLLADFISAGYQHAFADSIRTYLVENHLLVSREKRLHASSRVSLLGLSIFLLVFLFSLFVAGPISTMPTTAFAALIMTFAAVFSSFFITAIFAARELLPYLTEFETLATTLCRESIRLKILKVAAKAMMVVLSLIALGASALIFTAGFLLLALIGLKSSQQLIFISVFLAFPCLKAFLLLMRGWKLRQTEVATASGDIALADARKRLSALRPISALTQVLNEEDYNPVFSELMALYGVEALILLA